MVELARHDRRPTDSAAVPPDASVRLMQPDPIRRYWHWQTQRPVPARLIYGVLDVTDPQHPQRVLTGMEMTPAQGTQDYVLRLNPERDEWRVEIEDQWAEENGGRGATWGRLRFPAAASLSASADGQPRQLSSTSYAVLWKGEMTAFARSPKSLWFVARLARADDPVTDILDLSDAVRTFEGTFLPIIAKSPGLTKYGLPLRWIAISGMIAVSGICLLMLAGGGFWIWRGAVGGVALGRAAVALAAGGVLVGILFSLGFKLLHIHGVPYGYGIFLACELAASVLGIVSWRCRPGKLAAILAPVLALASLLLVA
jgi:hypothetical protein